MHCHPLPHALRLHGGGVGPAGGGLPVVPRVGPAAPGCLAGVPPARLAQLGTTGAGRVFWALQQLAGVRDSTYGRLELGDEAREQGIGEAIGDPGWSTGCVGVRAKRGRSTSWEGADRSTNPGWVWAGAPACQEVGGRAGALASRPRRNARRRGQGGSDGGEQWRGAVAGRGGGARNFYSTKFATKWRKFNFMKFTYIYFLLTSR
jgi:hypothetical protein